MRRFPNLVHCLALLPLYLLASVCFGCALTPSIYFFHKTENLLFVGLRLGIGYFIFGFSLILIVPFFNFILRANLKPWKGPYYSLASVRWYIHNGLTYLVRYTFLSFLTPTPFGILFFKLMGMKIGKGTQINSENISDPSLIELGQNVTIGGSATLIAHYGVGGKLVIAPLKIGNNVTIGLKVTVMGGVEIGDNVKILPNSVVLPKTKIPAGETWAGVPATRYKTTNTPNNDATGNNMKPDEAYS